MALRRTKITIQLKAKKMKTLTKIKKTVSTSTTNELQNIVGKNIWETVITIMKKDYLSDYILAKEDCGKHVIIFGEWLTEKSLDNLPNYCSGKMLEPWMSAITIDCGMIVDPIIRRETLISASKKLLKWAEQLPKAVTLSFVINVPKGRLSSKFAEAFDNEFHTKFHEVNHDNLVSAMTTAPEMANTMIQRMEFFAKANLTTISITKS